MQSRSEKQTKTRVECKKKKTPQIVVRGKKDKTKIIHGVSSNAAQNKGNEKGHQCPIPEYRSITSKTTWLLTSQSVLHCGEHPRSVRTSDGRASVAIAVIMSVAYMQLFVPMVWALGVLLGGAIPYGGVWNEGPGRTGS